MEPRSPTPPLEPPASPTAPLESPPGGWSRLANQAGGPPAGTPPPGWTTQPPPSAWPPQQMPPANWQQPADPPTGYGVPTGAPPPGMMWVPAKKPVTALAKIGALFLVVVGVFITLVGLLLIVGGAFVADLGGREFGTLAGAALAVVGLIILTIGILQILAGIGSWRGAGVARVLAIILALLFGLLSLAGAARTADASTGVVNWVVTIGYLYSAAVLIFAWKEK